MVSVVIPCYNYGHYLPAAVSSALDQEGIDVDVVIVDDASPDGSAEVARSLASADPRVTALLHKSNKGHIRTYNDGLAKARGDYVALLSADDLLTRNALSRAASLMEHRPSVGLVYGFARSFEGEPPEVGETVRSWSVWPGRRWLDLSTRKGRCFISSPEVLMRRAAFEETDGYDVRLPHSGDFDMWLRTAVNWDIGRVNGPAQALYRVHERNMHLTAYLGWITDLRERRATFDILFTERAPHRPDVTRLRSQAMRALARESLRHGLVAYRDGAEPHLVREYSDFAVETYPAVTSGLLWRLFELGPMADRKWPGADARRFASRVRMHVEWQRMRRYGT